MMTLIKRCGFILLLALFIVVPTLAYPGEIRVTHGKFDHFNIYMPEQMLAGEGLRVSLQAVDNLNNSILSFGEPKKFTISVTGSATVTPPSFDSSSFSEGFLTFTFTDKTAENGTLSITESGSPIPILSKEFSVIPGKLDSLAIKGPGAVVAGERFEIRIIEKDSFGNIVPEPIHAGNLNISFKGDTEAKTDLRSMPGFKNGVGIVNFTAEKTGTMMIEIKDMETGPFGVSEKIVVRNGPLHSFKVIQPKEVIAGEPFDFSVIPVDRFGNVVVNYLSTGKGVTIASSGRMMPFPSTIPAYAFVNGHAKASLRYDGSEAVKMTVTEIGNKHTGSSDLISFVSPIPERFEIVTPDDAVAGQKFKVKIIVYNQLSHVFKNYNVRGTDVLLSTTGTGVLTPDRIPPSEFMDGVAIVDLQYNKSESFTINASAEKWKAAPEKIKHTEKAKPPLPLPTTPLVSTPEKSKTVLQEPEAVKEQKNKGKVQTKEAKKVYEVQNISIEEAANRATLKIGIKDMDSNLVYKVDTNDKDGKKWVTLKIRSAVNKVKDKPNIVSAAVGDVSIEEGKKDGSTVAVKMKLLALPHFNVWAGGNSINVTILKP